MARAALGSEPCLAVEQTAVLSTDPAEARRIGRAFARHYLALPNYANNLMRLGFTEEEITNIEDRLVDAIVVWGSVDDVTSRVHAHRDAGASHVCVQVLRSDREVPAGEWRELASALL